MKQKPEKNITFLAFNLSPGGAEKVCLILSNEFAKRNYNTELWTVNYKENALTKQINKRVKLINLDREHVRNSFWPLLKMLIRKKPKTIIIFHPELAVIVILLKKVLFLKTAIIVRSINTLSQAYKFHKSFWGKHVTLRLFKTILPWSDKIVAQSTGMQIDLIDNLGFNRNKIITINNPAVISEKKEVIDKKNKEKAEFLFVGRLSPQKGLQNMLQAFRLAYKKNPEIRLTLVGEGKEKEKLRLLTENMELASSVTFEGCQSDIIKYYERARATLLTSHFEGFPNVLVESIATGTPVISFNCPSGPEDIIIPGKNGILVPHLNVEEFSKAILALANGEIDFNEDEVIESSKRFSIKNIVNQYEEVIKEF